MEPNDDDDGKQAWKFGDCQCAKPGNIRCSKSCKTVFQCSACSGISLGRSLTNEYGTVVGKTLLKKQRKI